MVVTKIKAMYVGLTQELEEILYELLFHRAVADVPLAEVVDSIGSS